MLNNANSPERKKGRLSLSISQELLDRLEPYKRQLNLSAHVEQMLTRLVENMEHRSWVGKDAEEIIRHGRDIAATGLAGEEFDRI